jgi:putative nucleotidyltransferase with HDIG domain
MEKAAQAPLIDYQAPLELAAKSMIRFKKPERLIKMIVRMIDEQIDTTHAAVLLYIKDKNYYRLIESKGSRGRKIPIGYARVNPESALIQIFTEKRNAFRRVNKDGLLLYRELEHIKHKDIVGIVPDIKKQMEILGATVCIPSYFKKQLLGILILGEKESGRTYSKRDLGLLVTLANDAAMAISNAQLIERLQGKIEEVQELYIREHKLFVHTSIALATAIDAKDPYTHGHTERVTRYSLEIFNEMGNKECSEESLHIAALLHDIGKIGVPDIVLNKKGSLKTHERRKIEEHTTIGANILMPIRELGGVIDGVRHHHEKFDGTGYPDGLRGDHIPFISRIIAVADTFDAITTDRPYRKKKGMDPAITEVSKHSGTQFDPEVVKAFLLAYQKGNIIV